LGAALEATPLSFGTVCAPGQRYHPALIAQAAATLAELYPQRFWLAVGTGEALNEAITGQPWPAKADRADRLRESVAIIRALWAGETVSTQGHITTQSARLYSRPLHAPLLLGAALSPETAGWLGSWADGMITTTGSRESMRRTVDAFRETAGPAKPMFLQAALSFAPSDLAAEHAVYDQWRHCVLPADTLAELPTPGDFDRACANADPSDVVARIRSSSDVERHLGWLLEDGELGYERIYVHNVARDHQERFIEVCGTRLLPALRR
jgi:G6PDH family F420-dependent oxidoreductase